MLPKTWEGRRNCPGRLFDATLCSPNEVLDGGTKDEIRTFEISSFVPPSKTFVWESNRVPKPPKSAYKRVNKRSEDGFFGLSTFGMSTTTRTHALEMASKRPRMRILTCWFGLTKSSFGMENATVFSRHNESDHCGEKKQSHLKVDKTNRPQQKQVFG